MVALVTVVERLRGAPLSRRVFIWFLGAFLLAAFFGAWHDEYTTGATLRREQARILTDNSILKEVMRQKDTLILEKDRRIEDLKSKLEGKPIEVRLPAVRERSGSSTPAPAVSDFRFAEKRTDSPDPQLPYALQVTIQTSAPIQPAHFKLEFSGQIANPEFSVVGAGAILGMSLSARPTEVEVSFASPPVTPEAPLVVTVLSKEDVRVKKIIRVR